MKAKKQIVPPNKSAAKKAPKMKTKVEEITRWESEGGAFIPTGQLPNAQQAVPDSVNPDSVNPDSINKDKAPAQR